MDFLINNQSICVYKNGALQASIHIHRVLGLSFVIVYI